MRGSFYCTFGCAANFGVKANSTLAKNYGACIRIKLNQTGGVLDLNELGRMLTNSKMEPSSESLDKT